MAIEQWFAAAWDAPAWIRAGVTTRRGGHSEPPYDSLNLATHVGDSPQAVRANRELIATLLQLPSVPVWLNQVHGSRIIHAGIDTDTTADAAWSDRPGVICSVMTADCVPVLLCNAAGNKVAAVHVGWKGFCSGIMESVLRCFRHDLPDLHVWIGPHVRSSHYEVGDEVRNACLARDNGFDVAFTRNNRGRWQASLERMIRIALGKRQIRHIAGTDYCTSAEPELFFSYRRDGHTGRMASMIWIDHSG